MSDHELITYAMQLVRPAWWQFWRRPIQPNWNPLENESDARWLATRLNIRVRMYAQEGIAIAELGTNQHIERQPFNGDAMASARRAITCCAVNHARSVARV